MDRGLWTFKTFVKEGRLTNPNSNWHSVRKIAGMKQILPSTKISVMKSILSVITVAAVMASCTAGPREQADTKVLSATDTAGLAEFQSFKMQNELAAAYKAGQQSASLQAATTAPVTKTVYVPVRKTTSTTRRSTPNYSMNSESDNSAKAPVQKKGWSKAAKGTAIGAAGGAVLGAVVNKKNRVVGGVVGGVLGGGIGYGIGRGMDKRDGRY